MESELSKEQHLLREVVARFLKESSPVSVARELMASELGFDRNLWRKLCDDADLAGAHIPERYGGSGLGPIELGIIAEEMGRVLFCGPFFSSSVMAGYALLHGADAEHRQLLLPGIASGSTLATLVLDDLHDLGQLGCSLRVHADGTLTGTAPMVLDAHSAQVFVVVARSDDGLSLLTVEPGGAEIEPLQSIDTTRKLSEVVFSGAAADKVGALDATRIDVIWDHLCVALAHEMIGGAQQMLESTVEYTKKRVQFGRPIGSFQALKHRCADLLMEIQLAKATVHHGARTLAAGDGETHVPSMAKAMASDAYMSAVKAGIQLRGGIGFTWEDDTHLWFKRAKSSEVFLGTPQLHRERMMRFLEVAS